MVVRGIALLTGKRFLPLFITQFFGAFNDNAFKLAMLTMISYHLSSTQAESEFYQALAGALFIIPFFIFSSIAGQLADKYDKALLARLVKILEVILIMIGCWGLSRGSIGFMMLTLTGMGIHSAFFGPIKYAILPDHLSKDELLVATGFIEGSTFIAILLGTILGIVSIGTETIAPHFVIWMILAAAFIGLFSSMFIPSTVAASTHLKIDFNLWRATYQMMREVKKERQIFLSIIAISWFWLVGAVLLTKLTDYVHYVLQANTTVFALFLALFSIGIAIGSVLIDKILKGCITLSLVPAAMLLFSWFTFDIYWASPIEGQEPTVLCGLLSSLTNLLHWRIAIDLLMLGCCGGLFLVPLYTYLQIASPAANRARVVAANNIYNSLFMVLGTVIVMLLLRFNITIPRVFFIFSILNAGVGLILWRFLRKN